MEHFAIVVDSTCDWSHAEYENKRVFMVPLQVMMGDDSFADQQDISSEVFYDYIASGAQSFGTSQPAPSAFSAVYEKLVAAGQSEILSLHIAAPLSGTLDSAEIAAGQCAARVERFDSCGTTTTLGILTQKACELRDAGLSLDEALVVLHAYCAKILQFISPDTTDHLLRGGRITADQAQQAMMLNIKMVFGFDDAGRLVVLDRVKGNKGIIKSYVERLKVYSEKHGALRIRVLQARNMPEAQRLVRALREAGIDFELAAIDDCGATITTHLGLGVIGLAAAPLNE
ncbi:MAG: DegV family protein [Raoultibacter sp.]